MKTMYKKVNYSFLRNPKLSLNYFSDTFINKNILTYDEIVTTFSSDFMKKSLYFASNSLYNSIEEDNGDKDKILASLAKYLTRMSTRSTPYGLLSSINLVSDNSNIHVDHSNVSTKDYSWHLSPDADWIGSVVKRLESNFDIIIHLKVKVNGNIYENENKLINIYPAPENPSSDSESIQKANSKAYYTKTALLNYVFLNAKEFISFDKLYKDILEITSSDVIPLVVFNYLKDLLHKNILISNLRPSLNGTPHLQDIVSVLENIKTANIHYKKLSNIHKRFMYINQLPISEVSIDFINETKEKMKNFAESSEYFNTILKQNNTNLTIPTNKIDEIEDLLSYLHSFSRYLPNKIEMDDYTSKFLDKFGKEREVPLTKVINPVCGLGFPSNLNISQRSTSFIDSLKQKFFNRIFFALASKEDEFDIRDIFSNDLTDNHNFNVNDSLSASIELAFITTSSDNTLNNKLYLSPIIGSNQAGKTPGRFIEAMDENQRNILNDNAHLLEKIYDDSNQIPVELNIIHNNGRILNIASNNSYFKYQTILGLAPSSSEIRLDEILVGIDTQGKLYLRSNKYNKRLHFSIFNNINSNICPPIYQFLLNLSEEVSPVNILGQISTTIGNIPITPRIVYKSIVLFPAKWKINYQDIDFKNFKVSLQQWFKKYTDDTLFYLKQDDNRLLVNIFNDIHLKEIQNYLKKNKSAVFNEVEKEVKDALYSNKETSIYEMILPFIYTDYQPKELISNNKYYPENDQMRTFPPFSEWTYMKFYLSISEDDFIVKHFTKIYNSTINKDLATHCFFIRYRDEKPHVRIRVKSKSSNDIELYKFLGNYINYLYKNKVIEKVVIDTYEREIERYGGCSCIDAFESFFSSDSDLCSYLLRDTDKFQLEVLATISIISMLNSFGLKHEEQIKLLSFVDHKNFVKPYREHRKPILDIITSKQDKLSPDLIAAMDRRSSKSEAYALLFNKAVTNEYDKSNLILSCIHMHCNRLFGTNREKEKMVVYFVLKTLKSLNYITIEG